MNIVKVNAVLSKALSRIQEGEAQGLRDLLLSEDNLDNDESTMFEEVIGALADKLVSECGVEDEAAISAIVEVAGAMADNDALPEIFGLDNPTEEDVEAWMVAVENSDLVEETVRYLSAS